MTKIGRLNVDLTANTRGFDVAMRNARTQLRELRKAAAPGLGAMGAGGLGQMMGVMAMSGPLAAIGAATMAVSQFAQQMAADRARGAGNLSEILVQRMSVTDQARFAAVSRGVTGEDSALPAREAMRAVQSMDWRQMSEAIGKGVERSTLESLKRITDPAEFFVQLQAAQRASPGLAEAVGGKPGEFIARSLAFDAQRIREAFDLQPTTSARQVVMAMEQQNRPVTDSPRELSTPEKWFNAALGFFSATRMAEQGLHGTTDQQLAATLQSIDRKLAGVAQ